MKQSSILRNFAIACLAALQAVLPCIVIAQQGPQAANPSGFVHSVSGKVFIRNNAGAEIPLKPGDVFNQNTTFVTGPDSSAVLLFADGQSVTLGKDTTLRVQDYFFDAKDIKSSRSTLALMSGMMRYVTGAIHTDNRDALVIAAGNAFIDVLSKEVAAFVVEVDQKSLGVGALAVTFGEVSLQTTSGRAAVVGVDQFTRWQLGLQPASPSPITAAPAVLQAEANASRAQVLGSNAPLDVQSAAVLAAISNLPATGAGEAQQPAVQAQSAEPTVVAAAPAVTPGGGRGCVGSPC